MKDVMTNRLYLLEWLALPLLIAWLAVGYTLGVIKNQVPLTPTEGQVLAAKNIPSHTVLESYPWDGQGLVSLWFDDAWNSQYNTAAPIVAHFGYRAALAVPTGQVGYSAYMTWPQIKRLSYSGWEIVSHGRNHWCNPDAIDDGLLAQEITGSFTDLLDHQLFASHYVPPCGETTPEYEALIKTQYLSLRHTDAGINPLPVIDPYDLLAYSFTRETELAEVQAWLEKTKTERGWFILLFHQIDSSQDLYSTYPDVLIAALKLVKQSGLKVVTPSQALSVAKIEL